jgi:Zn finger protein HypA/HybF involved in hydrogenase expression
MRVGQILMLTGLVLGAAALLLGSYDTLRVGMSVFFVGFFLAGVRLNRRSTQLLVCRNCGERIETSSSVMAIRCNVCGTRIERET